MSKYVDALKIISQNPGRSISFLDKEISMPNIPFPTMGGEVFWQDLAEFNGWRLQQNMFFKNARILRPDNVRVAWGTVNGMYKALDRLVDGMKNSRYSDSDNSFSEENYGAIEKIKQLKELLDIGAISQEEFNAKKAEL